MADFNRNQNFLSLIGMLQGAYSTAGQLANSKYGMDLQKATADKAREEGSRQFDTTNAINKEAVDWNKKFTIDAAKQGAQSKVAEDEAFRLYGKYGGVQRTLNPDGYSFAYTPYKMSDEQWKAKSGFIAQPTESASVVGVTPDGLNLIMSDGSFKPVPVDKATDPVNAIPTVYNPMLAKMTQEQRDKYKNVLKPEVNSSVVSNGDTYFFTPTDYSKEATNRFQLIPLNIWGSVRNATGEAVTKGMNTGVAAKDNVVNWWNYMMQNPNKTTGGKK